MFTVQASPLGVVFTKLVRIVVQGCPIIREIFTLRNPFVTKVPVSSYVCPCHYFVDNCYCVNTRKEENLESVKSVEEMP